MSVDELFKSLDVDIDEDIKQMFRDCPILLDENFSNKYPGIVGVASFLYFSPSKPDFYKQFGIDNLEEYLDLVKQEYPGAVRTYKRIKDIFRFE